MKQRKQFHLGDILSVTHDKLLSPRHIKGVYDILNFMTADNLYTHQLPRAADEAKPSLLRQHSFLSGVDVSDITPENHKERLAALVFVGMGFKWNALLSQPNIK